MNNTENNTENKRHLEGYVVTFMGVFVIVSSMMIGNNPVKMTGWIGFAAQAKFLPLLIGIVLTVLGIKLILEIKNCKKPEIFQYDIQKEGLKKLAVVILIVSAYLLGISVIGFLIPSILYFLVMLFYLNYKLYKPISILGIAAAFFILSYYLVPMLLKIQLP